jgi:hypothetical protein
MASEEEKLEIQPDRTVDVREMQRLFRLTPVADNDLTRPSRQVAIVAADAEDEARQIASMHDVFQRDWRDPHFAVRQNQDDGVGAGGRVDPTRCRLCSLQAKRFDGLSVYVKRLNRVSGSDKMRRHFASHDAKSDKTRYRHRITNSSCPAFYAL